MPTHDLSPWRRRWRRSSPCMGRCFTPRANRWQPAYTKENPARQVDRVSTTRRGGAATRALRVHFHTLRDKIQTSIKHASTSSRRKRRGGFVFVSPCIFGAVRHTKTTEIKNPAPPAPHGLMVRGRSSGSGREPHGGGWSQIGRRCRTLHAMLNESCGEIHHVDRFW